MLSVITRDSGQTVKALGLGKVGSSVLQAESRSVLGMIGKVPHLFECSVTAWTRGGRRMRLADLHPAPGSKTARKRVGRGIGSGMGKTRPGVTRARRPERARRPGWASKAVRLLCIADCRRERGFRNVSRKEYAIVNLDDLERFEAGTEITPELLDCEWHCEEAKRMALRSLETPR